MQKSKIEKFEQKVWLASPTMYGEELKYMTEAFKNKQKDKTCWQKILENIVDIDAEERPIWNPVYLQPAFLWSKTA